MTACPSCNGRGITAGRHWLGLAVAVMLEAGATAFQPDTYTYHKSTWVERTLRDERVYPTSDLGDLCTALAGREPDRHLGHDAFDTYNAVDKIIRAADLDPKTWGICQDCKGQGTT